MSRVLYLFDNVSSETIKPICEKIIEYNEEDNQKEKITKDFKREPIKLYIDSYGGDCYACLSLVAAMRTSKTPIHTYCNGFCMSSGAIIFITGHKRFISEYTTMCIHQVMSISRGYTKITDMKENVEETEFVQKTLFDIVLKYSKVKQTQLNKILKQKQDWYLHHEEILKYKLADEIIKEKECE